jgi:hypothetical protein
MCCVLIDSWGEWSCWNQPGMEVVWWSGSSRLTDFNSDRRPIGCHTEWISLVTLAAKSCIVHDSKHIIVLAVLEQDSPLKLTTINQDQILLNTERKSLIDRAPRYNQKHLTGRGFITYRLSLCVGGVKSSTMDHWSCFFGNCLQMTIKCS